MVCDCSQRRGVKTVVMGGPVGAFLKLPCRTAVLLAGTAPPTRGRSGSACVWAGLEPGLSRKSGTLFGCRSARGRPVVAWASLSRDDWRPCDVAVPSRMSPSPGTTQPCGQLIRRAFGDPVAAWARVFCGRPAASQVCAAEVGPAGWGLLLWPQSPSPGRQVVVGIWRGDPQSRDLRVYLKTWSWTVHCQDGPSSAGSSGNGVPACLGWGPFSEQSLALAQLRGRWGGALRMVLWPAPRSPCWSHLGWGLVPAAPAVWEAPR